jgi:hypothetical protein
VREVLGDLSLTQKVFSGGEFSPSILAFGGVKDAGICPSVLREEKEELYGGRQEPTQ